MKKKETQKLMQVQLTETNPIILAIRFVVKMKPALKRLPFP